MYNGIGLTSTRGSGTNGYVQRNMAHVSRQRVDRQKSVDKAPSQHAALRDPRKASAEIMDHKRKREVEVKVLALRESLEDKGVQEDQIEARTAQLRSNLLAKLPAAGPSDGGAAGGRVGETHADAASKVAESAAMKSALGIRSDYVGGQAFDREFQNRRKEEAAAARAAEEAKRLEAEAELERERAREEKRARKEARREEKDARREERREEKKRRRAEDDERD